ncbi:Pentatricopeptide repeat-containing protein [Thalictrum thalictroides]|uniref:Pentatricopeptide repeat-containing protein n=1 Tax=Thalictrum thalictroides TaxID=46969 RepID=A0A7J6VT76_THATH|nr:Pentatricopeptide repeat-containing protein [Thalictrum thalictroides]
MSHSIGPKYGILNADFVMDDLMQILSWMKDRNNFRMSAADHAILLELIIKVCSLAEAEEYFENISSSSCQKAACIPLLHSYVKEKAIEKAEALMLRMQGMGLTVDPHPFNEMMKLYVATGQFDKVPLMIQQMNRDKIPRNVLSYNLWMSACVELSGFASAEMVYREMLNDRSIEVGWSTLSTLANIYIRSGLTEKAIAALKTAEQKLSTHKRLGYFFLMTLYANLGNRDGILRLWEASKAAEGRMTCANYMCILLSLVKIGDIAEAEKVFRSWESECGKYDIRVSNILLGAYARSGCMDKAESLHFHTLEKGGSPNYKTWEILMEGWLKSKEMDKAIAAMKKGFSMLKHCEWRPSSTAVMSIAEYFEEGGHFEDAKKYVKVLRRFGLASLPLYKSLLKVYAHAQKPAPDILKMMENDKINLDEEASVLINCLTKIKAA